MIRWLGTLVMAPLGLSACRITPAKTPNSHELCGTESQKRIRYRPQGQPESLLGREVILGSDGLAGIVDKLRPGCVVRSNPVQEAWNRAYSVRVEETAGGGLSLPNIDELKAHYGETVSVVGGMPDPPRVGDCHGC